MGAGLAPLGMEAGIGLADMGSGILQGMGERFLDVLVRHLLSMVVGRLLNCDNVLLIYAGLQAAHRCQLWAINKESGLVNVCCNVNKNKFICPIIFRISSQNI